MKATILIEDWLDLEAILAKLQIGYKVIYDNHNGTPEMLINLDTISVYRREL